MRQAIKFRVFDTGEVIDTSPGETVEVNMGGMSLLKLGERQTTFTNSFKIPRTPNNERIFLAKSNLQRRGAASVKVVLSAGNFEKVGTLTVTAFNDAYSASFSYDDGAIEALKNLNFLSLTPGDDYSDNVVISSVSGYNLGTFATALYAHTTSYFPVIVYDHKVSTFSGSHLTNSTAITIRTFLSYVTARTGIIFSGDMLLDLFFMDRAVVINPGIGFTYTGFDDFAQGSVGAGRVQKAISCADVLRELAKIFLFDIFPDGMEIKLETLDFSSVGVICETLTADQELLSGYAAKNSIVYEIVDKKNEYGEYFGSDTFTADGVGESQALKINSTIPTYLIHPEPAYSGYNTDEKESFGKLVIMALEAAKTTNMIKLFWTDNVLRSASVLSYKVAPIDMAGFYSTKLTPLFTETKILNASGWIDPFTAAKIMDERVIFSQNLCGRYFVDSFAYNYITGNSKLKLIKL
jgi:hypothetical protein